MTYSTNISNVNRIELLKQDTLFNFVKNEFGLNKKTLKAGLRAVAVYSLHVIITSKTYHPNTINNAIRAYFCLKGEKAISDDDLKNFILSNTNSNLEEVKIIQVCRQYQDFTDDILAYSDISEIYSIYQSLDNIT